MSTTLSDPLDEIHLGILLALLLLLYDTYPTYIPTLDSTSLVSV